MAELSYRDEAAAGYDRAFAHVSAHFVLPLLKAAHVAPGMRVLDIAAGTGLVAEAALAAVGMSGRVTAADISPAMLGRARERLGGVPNASVVVEDGQALSFPDESFDTVLCGLGLMFFPDPARGLSEFRRVLRPGGHAAVSVTTSIEGAYNGLISLAIARRAPSLMDEASVRRFAFGADAARLRSLFEDAAFHDVKIETVAYRVPHPSFDAYFEPFAQGGASSGQAFAALPEETRRAVREEVRRDLGDTGGPIEVEVEVRIISGQR